MSFAQQFFYLLFFVCATLAQTTVNITENDWATLKLFFNAAGCKTAFCSTLQMNRTCVWPVICNNITGNVLQLRLNNYNLSGPLITEIAQLNSLQSLLLSNNRFTSSIPLELAKLSSLTLLDLSNNQFTGNVPAEFDRSHLAVVFLQGNLLNGVVPFFPRASSCILQTGTGNDFCCARANELQPCCANNSVCYCSNRASCPGVAPLPDRCAILADSSSNDRDYALCLTENSYPRNLPSIDLVGNFTVAFWAKARGKLNVTGTPTLTHSVALPYGMLFYAYPTNYATTFGIGFHLGTDGFDVVRHEFSVSWSSIAVQRESLLGWHHYSIVMENNTPFVYIDGNNENSATNRISNIQGKLASFRLFFGMDRNRGALFGTPTSFEGWISELRLANRSMHGEEAVQQINNQSAWDFSYSLNGCSGENHTGTEIGRFKLQQAFLVCKEPLPTCGIAKEEFSVGEQAGCLCESNDGTRSCIGGEWSTNDTVLAKPLARWLLNDVNSSIALDSSGNGFHGTFVGMRGVNYNVSSSHTSLFGGYINFGDVQAFNFGTRDFAISLSLRISLPNYTTILWSKQFNCDVQNFWKAYVTLEGRVLFHFHHPSSPYGVGLIQSLNIADKQWHNVMISRRGNTFDIYVDNLLHDSVSAVDFVTFYNNATLAIGTGCVGGGTLYGDIANVSIYVDTLPGPICSLDSNGYRSSVCKRVVGFCSSSKQSRQCCGATNCSECNSDYRSCSRNFSSNAKTTLLSSTTITTPMSSSANNSLSPSSSSSTTTNSTSVVTDVASNSHILPTIGWIGVVIGGVLCGLLVGAAVASFVCLRKRSTLSPSQTSLGEFHSVKNEDESQQPSRYSTIPPKPDHPYVDASFISIAEANEEIGRAMEQEANNKIEKHY